MIIIFLIEGFIFIIPNEQIIIIILYIKQLKNKNK